MENSESRATDSLLYRLAGRNDHRGCAVAMGPLAGQVSTAFVYFGRADFCDCVARALVIQANYQCISFGVGTRCAAPAFFQSISRACSASTGPTFSGRMGTTFISHSDSQHAAVCEQSKSSSAIRERSKRNFTRESHANRTVATRA